jgi:hypothetical protein
MIVTIPGFWVDMVMPFTNEGRVDPLGILKLLAFLESQGVETVVVGSNFGEGQFELGKDWRVVFKALQKGKGKLRVVVCVDTTKPTHLGWMVQQVKLAGLEGILVILPETSNDVVKKTEGRNDIMFPHPSVFELELYIEPVPADQQSIEIPLGYSSDTYPNRFIVGGSNDLIFQVSRSGNLGAYQSEDGPCSIHAVKKELKKRGIIASAFQLHPR